MPRHTPGAQTARRLILLATATVLTLAACGSGPEKDTPARQTATTASPSPSPSPTPEGVVTVAAAKRIVDRYEQVNNTANTKQDEALLSTVEAGQLNEQSRADYKRWSTWSKKEQKEYASPFFYTDREYFIPAAATASWFAVKARATASDNSETLMVFDRVDGTYKMVASVYADEEPIPEPAVDRHGLATAVDPSARVGTLAPDQLAPAFEDLFETGGTKEGKNLAPTAATRESITYYRKRNKGKNAKMATLAYFTADPAHPKVYALRLPEGGVLALFPTAHTTEFMLKPPYMSSFQITPTTTEALYNDRKRVVITNSYQGQALAALTPSGKPQVLAREYRLVDSR